MHAAKMGASKHGTASGSRASGTWEQSEFPIVCSSCLGDSAFIRMMKCEFHKECKICSRAFTVFRWQPGTRARYKNTEICQICAKLKNCCQTCLLDLEFGLPLQLRDHLAKSAGKHEDMPKTGANREFYAAQAEDRIAGGEVLGGGKAGANEALLRIARTAPNYDRNLPRVCAYWVQGECARGDQCPDRHEQPVLRSEQQQQQHDPVSGEMVKALPQVQPPEDKGITTLFIGGITNSTTDRHIRDTFYAFGEIKSIRTMPAQRFALVTFTQRDAAEMAMSSTYGNLVIDGHRVRVSWGKSQPHVVGGASAVGPSAQAMYGAAAPGPDQGGVGPIRGSQPPPPPRPMTGFPAPPPRPTGGFPAAPPPRQGGGGGGAHYPSMDPARLGARAEKDTSG